ncbi:phytanoyl-CoA dioxygenase family protein [Parerythrobacter lacustris]|uniref:Phytanoyl-CoA dioxygenase family protein n=1 Tax=Parerythrobacter lacustris TaxID=2969984 RepID=A0ABT1XMD1_9SPHN|nr:phytanoyl-CoA dioxygenase family protein [Parerythrobacter lacustris]MCR2832808.1 phytanoyl-CoA dioxygenase family protein [Parerythrobacter lacustris]
MSAVVHENPVETGGRLPEVACLHEFWAAHVQGGMPVQQMIERLLLSTLGLGNLQTYRFLRSGQPAFAEFEDWIVATAGLPDSNTLSRYHGWLTDLPPSIEAQAELAEVDAMPPALSEDDLAHWEEHGFVVLHNAITGPEAAALCELVWQQAGGRPDEPDSWYSEREGGIMLACYQHPALEAARRSPRVRKAFAQLWGTANLFVTIDQLGFNPPEREGHPFAGSDLHWDVSLAAPVPFATQGVLYLSDTSADQGAFRCVPGFHRTIDAWVAGLGSADPRAIDLHDREHYVEGRAGDLVIWHQALPHGASPNRSDKPRLAQYVNLYSPDMVIRSRWR